MLSASDLAGRLAQDAEAVCRHYLSAGRRAGNYWLVGNVANNKGRSLYVHLAGPRAGRWTDAATGQFGDLLDLVRETCAPVDFR
ncbi:DNA primase, partial (plasmid) [Rhizobium leguminosarum]